MVRIELHWCSRGLTTNVSQKKEQQKADNADAISGKKRKVKAAELRVQKGENGTANKLLTRICLLLPGASC